jgi:hypothetical protein
VRRTVVVVEEVADDEGIDFGAVVGCCDEATGGQVLNALPLLVHQQVHHRPDNAGDNHKGGLALGRFLHVPPATLLW